MERCSAYAIGAYVLVQNDPTPQVSDEQYLRRLGAELEIVPGWVESVGSLSGEWNANHGSELVQDDVESHPVDVSSGAWHAIVAAVSHIDSFRDSLFKVQATNRVDVRISTHGQFSLLRGALENASRAVWLLKPADRKDRILRRLQQDWSEQRQQGEIGKLLTNWSDAKTMDQRYAELAAIATRAGIENPKLIEAMPGYGKIVSEGTADLANGSNAPYIVWKACSALAHGDLRGALVYTRVVSRGSPSVGMTLGQMSGNVQLLARGGQIAIAATRTAFELYARRGGRSDG